MLSADDGGGARVPLMLHARARRLIMSHLATLMPMPAEQMQSALSYLVRKNQQGGDHGQSQRQPARHDVL
jgi:hypothetical protein